MDTKKPKFLDRCLSYPGIDQAKLQQRKSSWFTNLGVSVFVGIMTMVGALFQVHSIVLFGLMLLGIYVPNMILRLFFTFRRDWLDHLVHHLQLVITFYIIVRLGGLHNSGGIILAGLSMVITSISFNSTRWVIWYFAFYLLCMLTVAGIQFKLQLPAEMSPRVNHVFFLINTISLTAYTLVIVLVYLKQYTQIEKDKADKLKELDELKTRLYTNITHEFRTPLTVILGTADQIEAQPDKWLKKGLGKIRQNSQTLLHLVNQMLDLARLEAGAMPMKMIHDDVIKYLKYLSESFISTAESHKVQLVFHSEVESFHMDYDPDKLKRIVSNLLSNAIKYNRPEGTVTIDVHESIEVIQMLEVRIRDTGIGIPADRLEHVFDRFYRIEDGDSQNVRGTGLGLSITRELVKLLKGDIEVKSEMHKGTEFLIRLPVSHSASESTVTEALIKTGSIAVPEFHATSEYRATNSELPVLLIVEDNSDVSDYLFSLLENEYFIETAENGKAGLEKALSRVPDIILSDVMMPEMDGIAMLDGLKKDIRTSHIPVIMLTAKADLDSRLEGLETGAEAYLEKPFNKEELFVRLRKLVELRRKLRERYSSFTIPLSSDTEQFRMEDGFMEKLHASFQENLGDEDFGIEQLCDIMNMSRAQLYRKFKALTNRTIIDYLNSFRLHRARQLLQESDLNVTQVAYQVGYKNLSHFSHRFREEYGINPTTLKKNRS